MTETTLEDAKEELGRSIDELDDLARPQDARTGQHPCKLFARTITGACGKDEKAIRRCDWRRPLGNASMKYPSLSHLHGVTQLGVMQVPGSAAGA